MLTSFIPMMIVCIAKGPTGMELQQCSKYYAKEHFMYIFGLMFIIALKEKFYHPVLKLTNLSLRDIRDFILFYNMVGKERGSPKSQMIWILIVALLFSIM